MAYLIAFSMMWRIAYEVMVWCGIKLVLVGGVVFLIGSCVFSVFMAKFGPKPRVRTQNLEEV